MATYVLTYEINICKHEINICLHIQFILGRHTGAQVDPGPAREAATESRRAEVTSLTPVPVTGIRRRCR